MTPQVPSRRPAPKQKNSVAMLSNLFHDYPASSFHSPITSFSSLTSAWSLVVSMR